MVITGVIIIAIVVYAIWAIRKIHRNRKNGSCCGGEVVPDAPEKIIVTDNFEASTFGSIGFLICTVSNFRLQFPIGVIIILIGVVRDEENLYNKRCQ